MHPEPVLELGDTGSVSRILDPAEVSFGKSVSLQLWQCCSVAERALCRRANKTDFCYLFIFYPATGIDKVSHRHYYPLSRTGNGTPNSSNGGVMCEALNYAGINLLHWQFPAPVQLVVPQRNTMYISGPDHCTSGWLCSPDSVSNAKTLSWLIPCHLFLICS